MSKKFTQTECIAALAAKGLFVLEFGPLADYPEASLTQERERSRAAEDELAKYKSLLEEAMCRPGGGGIRLPRDCTGTCTMPEGVKRSLRDGSARAMQQSEGRMSFWPQARKALAAAEAEAARLRDALTAAAAAAAAAAADRKPPPVQAVINRQQTLPQDEQQKYNKHIT